MNVWFVVWMVAVTVAAVAADVRISLLAKELKDRKEQADYPRDAPGMVDDRP